MGLSINHVARFFVDTFTQYGLCTGLQWYFFTLRRISDRNYEISKLISVFILIGNPPSCFRLIRGHFAIHLILPQKQGFLDFNFTQYNLEANEILLGANL